MKARIIDGTDGLDALGEAWGRLEPSAVLPMQQFIWARACAATLTRQSELHVVVVEEAEKAVAIAPLVRRTGKSCLEMLGMTAVNEPVDFVYADGAAARELGGALVDQKIPLLLARLPADSLIPDALKRVFHGRGALIRRPDNSWPWLPLDARWVEPERQLNSGRRSDFRRAQRIAAGMGPVSSEIVAPTPSTLEPLLEEAFAVEAASWKGEKRSALALDPVRGAFFRQYASAACEKGILRLCFLRIGERAAAMDLAVQFNNRLWLLKIGYDQHFARCSPGILLLRETIRFAATQGLNSIEFLGTVEPWIRVWTRLEKPCVVLRGYPWGWRGMTKLTGDLAQSAWRKIGRMRVN